MSFDVDAWLDAAQPPTRAVKVYGRGDLVARAQALQLEADARPIPLTLPLVVDDRLAGPAPAAPDAGEHAAELAALVAQIEASAIVLTVRGILDHEQRELLDQALPVTGADGSKRPVDEALYELLLVERAVVEPHLNRAQAAKMRDAIGQAQWDQIFAAMSAASKEPVDVPLSRLGSESAPAS